MKYNTPELLLVGAAQNLVLGGPVKIPSPEVCLNFDDDFRTYHENGPIEDSACW